MVSIKTSKNASIAQDALDLSNLFLCFPVAIAIVMLLAIVVASYRQVIRAYPDGGGAYVVAKENLNSGFSLLAAAALLLDYVLTVAVSVCAGVAAITATFHATTASQELLEHNASVVASVTVIIALIYMNLRGLRESGRIVAVPAYLFVASMLSLIFIGCFRSLI